jgi:hypothetical protein
MGKFSIFLAAASVAVIASTAAWAVTDGSFTANDEKGKPIDGATVTVTVVKKPNPQKPKQEKQVIKTQTTTGGKVDLQYDEQKTSRDDGIAIIDIKKGGKTWTATRPLTGLGGGVPITFTQVIPSSVHTRTPTTYIPMPVTAARPMPFEGFGLSGSMTVNFGEQTIREYFTASDILNNTLQDPKTRLGGSVGGVWNFAVTPGLLVGPFADANFSHQAFIRKFDNGFSIGTSDCTVLDFGAQFGIPWRMTDKDALLYFQVGASETDQNLKIKFSMRSHDSQTIWGWNVGAGVVMQPRGWEIADMPISVFAQGNYINWQDGRYVNPLGSPGFTYGVQRDDLVFRGGLTLWFNPLKWWR